MFPVIENKTFDEIAIGDTISATHALSAEDVETWAAVTGNLNIVDLDPGPADTSMFAQGAGQTMWGATLFSTLAGTALPGLGSITRSVNVDFLQPVRIGEPVTATITVAEKDRR